MKESEAKFERRTFKLAAPQDKYLKVNQCVERIHNTFDVSRQIQTKSRLFDKERGATSGSKIIKIFVDFVGKEGF